MDFEQLKIFISVVENGSFTKAAETMYISHSTTSRNVSALEESLNVKLLIRDSRSIRLTEAGGMLFREGKALLEKVEQLENDVKSAGSGEAGKLSIASVSLFSAELNKVFNNFCAQYPAVVMGIFHRELSEVFSLVGNGDADLGVTFSYALPKDTEAYELAAVAEERFCVVCSKEHSLAGKKSVCAEDLRAVSYVGVGLQRSEFTKSLEEKILKDRPRSETVSVPSLESLFLQVRNGNGVSLVPYPMAREYGNDCVALDIEDVDTRFDIVVLWRKDNINPALLQFTQMIAEGRD